MVHVGKVKITADPGLGLGLERIGEAVYKHHGVAKFKGNKAVTDWMLTLWIRTLTMPAPQTTDL